MKGKLSLGILVLVLTFCFAMTGCSNPADGRDTFDGLTLSIIGLNKPGLVYFSPVISWDLLRAGANPVFASAAFGIFDGSEYINLFSTSDFRPWQGDNGSHYIVIKGLDSQVTHVSKSPRILAGNEVRVLTVDFHSFEEFLDSLSSPISGQTSLTINDLASRNDNQVLLETKTPGTGNIAAIGVTHVSGGNAVFKLRNAANVLVLWHRGSAVDFDLTLTDRTEGERASESDVNITSDHTWISTDWTPIP